jgi:hypothetical protein
LRRELMAKKKVTTQFTRWAKRGIDHQNCKVEAAKDAFK